jgi:S-DNA-T family DNA segregation ATPase FtsK/SpoIIIE
MTILANIIARVRLVKAFRLADLAIKHTTVNGKTIRKFPTIHSVKFFDERTEFVFTVPNGLDPKNVRKQSYVFRQVFGRSTELRGDLKRFVLNVYSRSLSPEIAYSYDDIAPVINGMKLPIVCGKNLRNEYVAYDMVGENRANILIAGEPGAGKSTQLRQILCTLIQTLRPHQLRLHLADLKRSEFGLFRGISHVAGVYVDEDHLLDDLTQLRQEIERRGDLLDRAGKTHIDHLRVRLPYIVVCIDEYSMVHDNADIESMIQKIGSLGRALGMYLIISMQRPSHDLLATKIRSLLSTRMGFRVAERTDAKMMGTPGAEDIKQAGRLICRIEQAEELQAPFLSEDKARRLLAPYRETGSYNSQNNIPQNFAESRTPLFGQLGGDSNAAT